MGELKSSGFSCTHEEPPPQLRDKHEWLWGEHQARKGFGPWDGAGGREGSTDHRRGAVPSVLVIKGAWLCGAPPPHPTWTFGAPLFRVRLSPQRQQLIAERHRCAHLAVRGCATAHDAGGSMCTVLPPTERSGLHRTAVATPPSARDTAHTEQTPVGEQFLAGAFFLHSPQFAPFLPDMEMLAQMLARLARLRAPFIQRLCCSANRASGSQHGILPNLGNYTWMFQTKSPASKTFAQPNAAAAAAAEKAHLQSHPLPLPADYQVTDGSSQTDARVQMVAISRKVSLT